MKISDAVNNSYDAFGKWALLNAGDSTHFNSMTISWGEIGSLWGKKVVTVYVKPTRYTYEFIENSDVFSISFFDDEHHKALEVLGSLSGRNQDKIAISGLTPIDKDGYVSFKEAKATIRCRKIYQGQLEFDRLPPALQKTQLYADKLVHGFYIGEIIAIDE